MPQACACGCGRILRTVEPFLTYKIRGKPEEYATAKCRDDVYNGIKTKPSRRDPDVKVPAPGFGGSGVTRTVCNHCQNPVVVNWKGNHGDYDTLECRTAAEPDFKGENEMTDTNATATPVNDSPIAAGTAAPKKAAKKTATKTAPAKATKKVAAKPAAAKKAAAPAKKVAAKPAKAADPKPRNGKFADTAKLHLTGKDHNYRAGTKRGDRFNLIKEGMTIAKFKEKVDASDAVSFLAFYVADGTVELNA